MMKKGILILLAAFISFGAVAQKIKIQSALNAIKVDELDKAKEYIDAATSDPSTEKDGKAWLIKAFVYQAIGTDKVKNPQTGEFIPFIANINGNPYVLDLDKAKSLRPTTENPLEEAAKALNRHIYFEKKPNDQVVVVAAYLIARSAYTNAVAYTEKNAEEAIKNFEIVEYVANLKKGEYFPGVSSDLNEYKNELKKLLLSSKKYKAYIAYEKDDDALALPLLEEAMKTEGAADDNIYLMAARIYNKQNNKEKYMQTLKAGLAKYPASTALKNEELNTFVTGDDAAAAAKKLEEAISEKPNSPELRFNLGVMYDKLSQTATDKNKQAEYFVKSEVAYKKAIELDATNSDYQYNLGVLYFNKAKNINDEMNKLPLDDKKYDVMKKERDDVMAQGMPYLEQAKTTLEAKGLKDEMNSVTYKNTMIALQQGYSLLGKLEKAQAAGDILNKL